MEKYVPDSKDYLYSKDMKNYLPPTINVTIVLMEYGIAAGSASVSPVAVGGNVDQIQTEWNGNDNTTIDTPF